MAPSTSKSKASKKATSQVPQKKTAAVKHIASSSSGSGKLPVWQRILNAIAVLESRGQKTPNRHQVAGMCGYPKENGKGYTNALSMLKNQKKYVIVHKETLKFTDEGRRHAHTVSELPSAGCINKEQWERAKAQIKPSKGKQMIDILSDGKAHSRQEIADKFNIDVGSKGFTNLLSSLKKDTFIEYCEDEQGNKAVRMQEWLFPERFAAN